MTLKNLIQQKQHRLHNRFGIGIVQAYCKFNITENYGYQFLAKSFAGLSKNVNIIAFITTEDIKSKTEPEKNKLHS